MTETTHDKNRRSRIHLTVVALTLLVVAMFVSAAWLRIA